MEEAAGMEKKCGSTSIITTAPPNPVTDCTRPAKAAARMTDNRITGLDLNLGDHEAGIFLSGDGDRDTDGVLHQCGVQAGQLY